VADYDYSFTASAAPLVVTYRANGPYDPEYAVGGGQPRYYDTLLGADSNNAPYHQYRVRSCDASVELTTQSGAPAHLMCGFRAYDDAAPTSVSDALELGYKDMVTGGSNGGPTACGYHTSGDIAKIVGKSAQAIVDDDAWSADYNTTPSEEVLFDVIVVPATSTTSHYYVTTHLSYHMDCFALNRVAPS